MRSLMIFFVLAALCGAAFAADVPAPDKNTTEWLKALYTAATAGEWKAFAGLVMVGVTFAIRVFGAKYVKWFASRNGGVVMNFVVSLLATLGVAFASRADVTLSTIFAAVSTALAAAGVWELLKAYVPAIDAKNEAVKALAQSNDAPVNQ